MTIGSRNSAALLALLLAATSASAQPAPVARSHADGPPRSLALEPLLTPEEIRERAAPAQPSPAEPALTTAATPDGVSVSGLANVDVASLGVLTREQGGLPPDLWTGSDIGAAIAAVEAIPVINGMAANRLARRLLLTTAPAPQGAPDQSWRLMTARIDRLAAAGQLVDVVRLMAGLPIEAMPQALARQHADYSLLAGDFSSACAVGRLATAPDENGNFLKLSALCRAMAGDRAGADLALDMLADIPGDQGPFLGLFDRLLDPKLRAAPFAWPQGVAMEPLLFALAVENGIPLPAELEAGDDVMLVAALAASPWLAPEARLRAAERLVGRGAYAGDDLRAVLAAANPADAATPALRHAALYQQAVASPGERPALLGELWLSGWTDDAFPALAAAAAPLAAAIEPSPGSGSANLVRALAIAGDAARLDDWYRMMRSAAEAGDPALEAGLLDLWALALVADRAGAIPYSDRILGLWTTALQGRDPDWAEQARYFYALLEGLGYPLAPELWLALDPLATPALEAPAASDASLGEAIARALARLGAGGAVVAAPDVLRGVLADLRRFGLDDDARAIAIEALVLRGY